MAGGDESIWWAVALYSPLIAITIAGFSLAFSIGWAGKKCQAGTLRRLRYSSEPSGAGTDVLGAALMALPGACFWLSHTLLRWGATRFDPPLESPQTFAFGFTQLLTLLPFAGVAGTSALLALLFTRHSSWFILSSVVGWTVPFYVLWPLASR